MQDTPESPRGETGGKVSKKSSGESIKVVTRSPKKEVGKSPKELQDVTRLYQHKKLHSSPGGLITTDLRQPKLMRKPSAPVKLASSEGGPESGSQTARNTSVEGRSHVRSKSGSDFTGRVTEEENPDKCLIS